MITQDYQDKFIAAEVWEKAFASFLVIERGYHVLPACDYRGQMGHAPHLAGAAANITLPDLLVARGGKCRWIEVKQKSHADFHRNSNRFVTGLPIRQWDEYLRVQEVTGIEVTLVFIHAEENVVVGDTLAKLTNHISHRYTRTVNDTNGTLFFKFGTLPRLIAASRLHQFMNLMEERP